MELNSSKKVIEIRLSKKANIRLTTLCSINENFQLCDYCRLTIEVSCDDDLLQNFTLLADDDQHPFNPVQSYRLADVSVYVSSLKTPPIGDKKIISAENNLWQLYSLGNGFLDCRFTAKNPYTHYWWACIDHYYRKIDIGVNLHALRASAHDKHKIQAYAFATDRKLIIPAILNHGVLSLHSAGGEVKNKGIVIAGTSGTGKSTLASLLKKNGHHMFSDEAITVRSLNNVWFAHGTPWPSSAGIVSNESAPLGTILFLRQAKTTSFQRLSKRDCIKRILQFSSIPWHLPHLADVALSICEQLVSEVPMYEMNCSLDDQPIEAIERLAESL